MEKHNYNKISEQIKEKVIDLYVIEEYGSITIGRKLNISKTSVLKILKNNNISRRSTSEAGKKLFSKGYKHPMIGRKLTNEHKQKMKIGRKNITVWNKGLTKKDNINIKGGRISKGLFFDKTSGYVLIYKNNKVQKYHRWLFENINGKIPYGHVIHHLDGDKTNNNIQNLKLMKISEHTKLHWKQGDIRGYKK